MWETQNKANKVTSQTRELGANEDEEDAPATHAPPRATNPGEHVLQKALFAHETQFAGQATHAPLWATNPGEHVLQKTLFAHETQFDGQL